MATVKGGLWHRRWGKAYFWSMAWVALSAAVLCWLRSGLFLFLIAIFSFYLALTGYRVLWRKRPESREAAGDWVAAGAMLAAGGALVVTGTLAAPSESQRWVRIIFGLVGAVLGATDFRQFLRPPSDKGAWLRMHVTRFGAAYIATITAFSVVNFQFLPELVRWLWPTIIGAAGLTVWRRLYAPKG